MTERNHSMPLNYDVVLPGLREKVSHYVQPNKPVYHQSKFIRVPDTGHTKAFANCFRCWKPQGNHRFRHWRRCRDTCAFCGKNEHHGQPCPDVYATAKWWSRYGGLTMVDLEYIQLRPTRNRRKSSRIMGILDTRMSIQAIQTPTNVSGKVLTTTPLFQDTLPSMSAQTWQSSFTMVTLNILDTMTTTTNQLSTPPAPPSEMSRHHQYLIKT